MSILTFQDITDVKQNLVKFRFLPLDSMVGNYKH
jgi:hypothetical protein